jgi:general L-amino acid transport system permease protein
MIYVVLPQAFRVAIPPLGNQYLNLFKNSSLGVVISYFELTKVTQTQVANGAPAVPAYAMLMLLYLIGSLILSRLVNIANRRLELVER